MPRDVPEGAGGFGDLEIFPSDRLAAFPRVERKAPVVREEDLSVMLQVTADLRGLGKLQQIVVDRFHLQHTALGLEFEERTSIRMFPQLLSGKEASIRKTRAAVRRVNDRGDLRLERPADGIEEIGESRITGGLGCARAADSHQISQKVFRRAHSPESSGIESGRQVRSLRAVRELPAAKLPNQAGAAVKFAMRFSTCAFRHSRSGGLRKRRCSRARRSFTTASSAMRRTHS